MKKVNLENLEFRRPLLEHTIGLETIDGITKETYNFRFKDKPGRSAIKIWNDDGATIKLKELRIIKVPRKNNRLVIELYKVK